MTVNHTVPIPEPEREPAPPSDVQNWWFTFGSGQRFVGFYVVINGTYDGARDIMMAHFGRRWSFQYPTAERAGVAQYSLAQLEAHDWPPAAAPKSIGVAQVADLTPPDGTFTAPIQLRYGLLEPGWWVKVEATSGAAWLLVESRAACTRPGCHVARDLPWGCAVITLRGRGTVHLDAYDPATVRIPADTVVEW